MSRHDYMPFGEELGPGTGGRTTGMGYGGTGDTNRTKFTGYERDAETGLDFAQARFYGNIQGRFTSPDPFSASAVIADPQTFNRYAYCRNNPVNSTDPTGMIDHSVAAAHQERQNIIAGMHAEGMSIIAEDEAHYEQMVYDAFRGVREGTSVTVVISEPTEGQGSANNPDTIDNSASADQSCKIQISFTGSGLQGMPNGSGTVNTTNGFVFGVGFSAEVSELSGGVYKFGAGKYIDNKKGKWKIEQWVAAYNVLNGELALYDQKGRADHIETTTKKEITPTTAKWWDHPGHTIAGVNTLLSKKNFYVKAYNGSRHCEVDFHINVTRFFGVWRSEWGQGPPKN
jgi:RHS repeat-associated protein